ncbi:uncharacterized protein LOC119188993 [Manduca sexta]|uniref:uncharacterized protein LOC119188993 n=1 Tax=Manduca sexta TaxID=7130 RepID=UPI0018902249|nr:uncharacterized protein LOC119188993 [Manduca sexta]
MKLFYIVLFTLIGYSLQLESYNGYENSAELSSSYLNKERFNKYHRSHSYTTKAPIKTLPYNSWHQNFVTQPPLSYSESVIDEQPTMPTIIESRLMFAENSVQADTEKPKTNLKLITAKIVMFQAKPVRPADEDVLEYKTVYFSD